MSSQVADPLLGVGLPTDDPSAVRRLATDLGTAAARLGRTGRGVGGLLPTHRWSGVAARAADARVGEVLAGTVAARVLLLRAAAALAGFAAAVDDVRAAADDARRLVAAARAAQRAADRRDPHRAAERLAGWSGHDLDGGVDDAGALALLARARHRAYEAQSAYDAAARRLTDELTALSGRRVVRHGLSPRLLVDVAGLVPGVGDGIDAVNALAYAWQGRWTEAAFSAAAVVPGPLGWAAASFKVGRAVERAGEVARVVDDVPAEVRVAEVARGLTRRGRRADVRVLDSDAEVERLYRSELEGLGDTRVVPGPLGPVSVTWLKGGGRVVFRTRSREGGAAIEFHGIDGVPIGKIHVVEE